MRQIFYLGVGGHLEKMHACWPRPACAVEIMDYTRGRKMFYQVILGRRKPIAAQATKSLNMKVAGCVG
jgi:hypothetical protein